MRLALVLALVSSLQIFQQSTVNRADFSSIVDYSLAIAAFPIGKFVATCFLAIYDVDLHQELDRCAKLLIIGAAISAIPIFRLMTSSIGRFLMGFSAGSGFVCAPAVLRLAVPVEMRPANFMFLAAAFSMGTFLANSMFLIENLIPPFLFSSFLTGVSGLLYLSLRPSEYPNFECVGVESEETSSASSSSEPVKSTNPVLFVFLLMVLNVSIGVPLMQTFSTTMFTYYGVQNTLAQLLSILFPVLQFIPVMASTRISISRKMLILGGYYVAIMTQFLILITSYYNLLPEKHKMIAMVMFLMILSISFSVPCNTGLCLVFEQFDGGNVKTASKSRCVMWFLSSISTLTFAKTLSTFGFSISFLPYFATSAISYLTLLKIFPKKKNEILEA